MDKNQEHLLTPEADIQCGRKLQSYIGLAIHFSRLRSLSDVGILSSSSSKREESALADRSGTSILDHLRIEKGLSLRLGRSSNIRDTEITLPIDPNEPRSARLGRINGMICDQLYSSAGLFRPDEERGGIAESLEDTRALINETHAEISVCFQCLHHP